MGPYCLLRHLRLSKHYCFDSSASRLAISRRRSLLAFITALACSLRSLSRWAVVKVDLLFFFGPSLGLFLGSLLSDYLLFGLLLYYLSLCDLLSRYFFLRCGLPTNSCLFLRGPFLCSLSLCFCHDLKLPWNLL